MELTHAQVVHTLEQRVDADELLSIVPDRSSSSDPPNGFDTPEYWQILYMGTEVATLYNTNFSRRIPRIGGGRIGGDLPLPLAGVEPGLQMGNPKLYSALEELTDKRIYPASTIRGAQLQALRK